MLTAIVGHTGLRKIRDFDGMAVGIGEVLWCSYDEEGLNLSARDVAGIVDVRLGISPVLAR